jgi:pyridoxal phosphate enzyme (YggS family)
MTSIAANLQAVRARIAAACVAAGRPVDSVQLLAVSKTWPAASVLEAVAAGQRAFGENYVQEAIDKKAELACLKPDPGLEWHFIGPLQSNKTRPVAENFTWVHSVDRLKIAERLSAQRPPAMAPIQLCLQVNVSGEASKSGCSPAEVPALARAVATLPGLRLRGLMAIPEPTDDPARQQEQFAVLRRLRDSLDMDLDTLSMGMSHDLEPAIMEGATIVRVGTAIFGQRNYTT